MKQVTIFRRSTGDQGTFGYIIFPGGWFYTIELPWRDNKRSISCIPADTYIAQIRKSPKYGKIYWVVKVPGRSWILIHSMNVAGDVTKGYKTHSEGCIGVGERTGMLWGQKAILVSRPALRKFMKVMNGEKFRLTIVDATKEA